MAVNDLYLGSYKVAYRGWVSIGLKSKTKKLKSADINRHQMEHVSVEEADRGKYEVKSKWHLWNPLGQGGTKGPINSGSY